MTHLWTKYTYYFFNHLKFIVEHLIRFERDFSIDDIIFQIDIWLPIFETNVVMIRWVTNSKLKTIPKVKELLVNWVENICGSFQKLWYAIYLKLTNSSYFIRRYALNNCFGCVYAVFSMFLVSLAYCLLRSNILQQYFSNELWSFHICMASTVCTRKNELIWINRPNSIWILYAFFSFFFFSTPNKV